MQSLVIKMFTISYKIVQKNRNIEIIIKNQIFENITYNLN